MAYAHIRPITIDATKVGGSDQTDFAFPVAGTYSYLATVGNGGEVQHAQGYDRAYFADSALTTPLDFETESYNAATGAIVDWVRVPSVSHTTNTVIYEAHGDAGISTFQGDVNGTWDGDYGLVDHMAAVSGTLTPQDSTANANSGSLDTNPPTATTGKIGGAGSFAGGQSSAASGGGVTYVDAAILTPSAATGFTISAWVNRSSATTGGIAAKYDAAAGGAEYIFGFLNSDIYGWIYDNSNGAYYGRIATGVGTTSQWDYLVFSWADPDAARADADFDIFQNGTKVDDAAFDGGFPTIRNTTQAFGIGNWTSGLGPGVVGKIDEVRFSTTKRAPDWVTATYNSQNDPATFYSVGADLLAGHTLTAAQGSFTFTGESVALRAARRISVTAGTFAFTGEAVGLTAQRKLTAAHASFTLTGEAVNLVRGRPMVAAQGAFTLTGEAVALRAARKIAAGQGSFTLTGEDVSFSHHGAAITMVASYGAFTFTGEAVGLRSARRVAVTYAPFTLTWQLVAASVTEAMRVTHYRAVDSTGALYVAALDLTAAYRVSDTFDAKYRLTDVPSEG